MARVPINHRILRCESNEIEYSGESAINLSDTVFEFLSEECEGSSPASSVNEIENDDEEKENRNENEAGNDLEDIFWEKQLMSGIICRTSSLETRIRVITKEAVKEVKQTGNLCGCGCGCGRPFDSGCRKCLMEEVCRRLQSAGFDSAICKSKWRSSPDIPSGEHTFLDVVDNSNPKRGQVRVIIELNIRAEFEMARANEEYNKLVKRLPEIFVGKIERLLSVLKILCAAAKKCMKEKKMHLGPWRKHGYMQAKWLRTCERLTSSRPLSSGNSGRVARPRMSILTFDLMENLSNLHGPTVEVV
ncbi:hypothetical protein ACJIZ3_006374 [Penstemon smallii]|uniref:Uncharacterized protein n=1 Tax=Penstemon smallii TaxID=265156 RepID=A0ABD3S7N6_9LAMI